MIMLRYLLLLAATKVFAQDWDANDYYAVHIDPKGQPADKIAAHLGLKVHSPFPDLADHYLLEGPKNPNQDVLQDALARRKRTKRDEDSDPVDGILLSSKQIRRKRLFKRIPPPPPESRSDSTSLRTSPKRQGVDAYVQKGIEIAQKLSIEDPIFHEQWHLFNQVNPGNDINVTGVWLDGITGKGSKTCIIDDGLDFDSDDLKANYYPEGSHDYNDPGPDPKPRLWDDKHGTRCAGEIAAVKNHVCGVGVAYDSKVAGVRILSGVISDTDEAKALNYNMNATHIYSCSWGPPDNGEAMEAPNTLVKRAMLNGIQNGRQGLGSLFVFAAGNGRTHDDDCNFDGYTNSIYSVSVGGINHLGERGYYSERCSALLVTTYSSGHGDAIHTTDVGKDLCYTNHGGTSAAGPLVAATFALVLEVRPDLHWRDFQWITVMTSVPVNDNEEGAYQATPLGRRFSHQYGYGKLDAYALVQYAKTFKSVKPQAWYYSPWLHVRHAIPQGKEGLASSFEVTKDMLAKANLERIEHVTVTMNIDHSRRGDLSADLISPAGIVSHIATVRRNDVARQGYIDWTFMSVAHWGEDGVGKWTVVVKDTAVNEFNGTFTDWRLKLWGESIDGTNQPLVPLPTDHDDDDHALDEPVQVVGAVTTTHGQSHPTGEPAGVPSDHIERPVNSKTSIAPAPTAPPAQSDEEKVDQAPPTEAGQDTTSAPDDHDSDTDPDDEAFTENPNFLPSPFPTFGVSKSSQVWIYGAVGLIILFCVSLVGWWMLVRRRANRTDRDDYEFEMVGEEDADDDGARTGLVNGGSGGAGARTRTKKRRAGELYDAFAEGSEDEEDVFKVGDGEDDEERYRDEFTPAVEKGEKRRD